MRGQSWGGPSTNGDRSGRAAAFVAAASVPVSFQRTLRPRSILDQGLITGIAFVAEYAAAAAAEDVGDALAARLARTTARGLDARMVKVVGNALMVGGGLALQLAVRRRDREHLGRAAVRLAGWYGARAGVASEAVLGLDAALAVLHRRGLPTGRLREFPLEVPLGTAIAVLAERRLRHHEVKSDSPPGGPAVAVVRPLAVGGGVCAALAALTGFERRLASWATRGLAAALPGEPVHWRLAGHATALAALAAGVLAGIWHLNAQSEAGEAISYAGTLMPPACPSVSCGTGSLVGYGSLTREGRRFVSGATPPAVITETMGCAARAHPIRIYVGLGSASTEAERVRVAAAEMDRTGALARGTLVLVSPTGTGWVNDVAVEAIEHLTRGDVATVALQYSRRLSPLSLDRVDEGRRQNHMLWHQVHERLLQRPPEQRPKVVLFGESLGAHTSQDAFLHEGTSGLSRDGIDAALWIGTPFASEWKEEVLGRDRPDVDRSLVARVASLEDLEALDAATRDRVRYVLYDHHDDAVSYFGFDLLLAAPLWLGPRRPASVPAAMRWHPIPVFLQTLFDMKNGAQVRGEFEARGHDYRRDLTRLVAAAYGFEASPQQIARVEAAVRRSELRRSNDHHPHEDGCGY